MRVHLAREQAWSKHRPDSQGPGRVYGVDRLFDDLTDRQLAALQIALENGYYEQPRGCSISELAEGTTVSRATFEGHLRKAENELVTNNGQFVRLVNESLTDGRLLADDETIVPGPA